MVAAGHELWFRQNVNNKVDDPFLLILTVLQLDIKKKETLVPKSFYFCTR